MKSTYRCINGTYLSQVGTLPLLQLPHAIHHLYHIYESLFQPCLSIQRLLDKLRDVAVGRSSSKNIRGASTQFDVEFYLT